MRRTRHTRRRTRHKRKHRRRRTRRHHKRRRTRHRRRRGGNCRAVCAMGGGYVKRGGKSVPFSVSDIPPGKAFEKFVKRDKKKAKEFAKKMKKGGVNVNLTPSSRT